MFKIECRECERTLLSRVGEKDSGSEVRLLVVYVLLWRGDAMVSHCLIDDCGFSVVT